MKVINVDKLDGYKTIVLVGRDPCVRKIARYLEAVLYYCPRQGDYFKDYASIINEMKKSSSLYKDRIVIYTTQSAEFLDCLLVSDVDFILATVRKFDNNNDEVYRLRVLSKKEAWKGRCDYNMELRE